MASTMMRPLIRGLSCVGLLCTSVINATGTSSVNSPHADSDVVLSIGDEHFDRAQYSHLLGALLARVGTATAPAASNEIEGIVRDYAQSHILAIRAREEHLDRDPAIAARLSVQADLILAEVERLKLMRDTKVDELAVEQRFAQRPGDYDEYHLRHIFLVSHSDIAQYATQEAGAQALERAKALKARLDAGADFDQLARSESDDHATAAEGGQLSAMFGQYLADEFAPTVRALKEGEVSSPVEGNGGYHLIRLDRRRVADYEHVHPMIEAQLRSEAVDAHIDALLKAKPVVVDLRVKDAPVVKGAP